MNTSAYMRRDAPMPRHMTNGDYAIVNNVETFGDHVVSRVFQLMIAGLVVLAVIGLTITVFAHLPMFK